MESRTACAFCAGRRGPDSLARLGIETSSLEREPAHDPDCPLLSKKPIRWWTKALMLSIVPTAAFAPEGCRSADSGPEHYSLSGLDDGTISALSRPETDDSVLKPR